ncbi:MAG: hypothetical protein NTU91_00630, partial [Chloroflexi bacterium]|nr:hypothetical protein [Chloroflexota bacterium]
KIGNVPWVTVLGLIGGVLASLMALAFLLAPQLGLVSKLAYTVVFGIIAFWAIYFFIAKRVQKSRGINVDYAFKEVPPE